MEKQSRHNKTFPPLESVVEMNSLSNTVGAFSIITTIAACLPTLLHLAKTPLTNPLEIAAGAAAIATGAVSLMMKQESIRAYRKTKQLLEVSADRSEESKDAAFRRLTARARGSCAVDGIRQAYMDYYGDEWESKFKRLTFPNIKF
jgi:hypothetical protein